MDFDKDKVIAQFGEFIPFCAKRLGLSKLPRIEWFTNGDVGSDHHSFGSFHNGDQIIRVCITNRHPMDIMRTLAHELTHYKQWLDGKITDRSGETGSPIENEANATAGVIMRDWGKLHPDMFKEVPITEDEDLPKVIKLRGFALSPDDTGYDPTARAKRWIDKITARMSKNPLNPNQHAMLFKPNGEHALAMFELVPSRIKPGATEIKWFAAHPTGSGIGKQAMQKLQSWATEDNMPLTLYPWDRGEMSQSQLISFYKRLGFSPIKGHKDMLWQPNNQDLKEETIPEILSDARSAINTIKTKIPEVKAIMNSKTLKNGKMSIKVFVTGDVKGVNYSAVRNKLIDINDENPRTLDIKLHTAYDSSRKSLSAQYPDYLFSHYRTGDAPSNYEILRDVMPDGPLMLSKHFKERIDERELDYKWLLGTIKKAVAKFGNIISSFGPGGFVIKDNYAGIAMRKILQPDDSYLYNAGTVHSTLYIYPSQNVLDITKNRVIAENSERNIDRILDDLRNHPQHIDSAVDQIVYSVFREQDLVDRYRAALIKAVDERKIEILRYLLGLIANPKISQENALYIVSPAVRALTMLGMPWPELDVIKRSIDADRSEKLDEIAEITSINEGLSSKMSVTDILAYLRKVMDVAPHPDWRDHITNTNDYFELKTVPVKSLKSELSGLNRENVEKYKKMDFSKAPPIVIGSDGHILDGYHRVNVAKALEIPTIRAYVGIKSSNKLDEQKLTHKDPVERWISVFKVSKHPKFKGKSPEQREKMARAAQYRAVQNKKLTESRSAFPQIAADVLAAVPQTKEIWLHGSRAIGKHKRSSDWDILVIVPNSIEGAAYVDVVMALHSVAAKHPKFDIQPAHRDNQIARIAREEGEQIWVSRDDKLDECNNLDKPTPTVSDLTLKHNASVSQVRAELDKGIEVEKEHTSDPKVAREIALDHLGEDLYYYVKLAKVEKQPVAESSMQHINQQDGSGALEGYVVDTDQPQLMNYLTGQGASEKLVMKLAEKFNRIAIIRNMWVDEDARGQGTGSSMLESAIDEAFANGAEAIMLVADLSEDNSALGKSLDQWYEGWGFKKIGLAGSDPVMILTQGLMEAWSKKYKKSIDCSNPNGFSQRAHCAGRKARSAGKKTKSQSVNEADRTVPCIAENFADGKGPGKPGDSQRHGIPKGATIAQLEKHAKRPGRAGQLARWQLNMRRGKSKR
jgi:GNAT superfamily N-acetyltransferase/predicted nucleotidyltransferase